MTTAADTSPRIWARAVGFLYLLMIAIGSIPLLVGRVRMSNDAQAVAAAILAHPSQVHTAFAANLLVVVCYLPVTALFYKLFKPVNDTLSLIAAFFGLAGCAVQGFACLFRIAPLIVLTSGQSSSGINQQQVQTFAYLLLELYTPAYNIIDLGARYGRTIMNRVTTWRIGVNNVSDAYYWSTLGPGNITGTNVGSYTAHLGAPRTIAASMEVAF